MKLIIHTDGGARGNPGPAAIGLVIKDAKNKVVFQEGKCIGETTNNQAEYQALVSALEHALKLGGTEVACYLDSELVVKQVRGEYKVKDASLAKQFLKIHNLKTKFKILSFHHIARERNREADALVNQALDGVL